MELLNRLSCSFLLAAALLTSLSLRVEAVAPPNDLVKNAIVLPGTSGSITGATTVGSTVEPRESVLSGSHSTIWYSFTALAEGYLLVTYDKVNDKLGVIDVEPFIYLGGSLSPRDPPITQTVTAGNQYVVAIPFAAGATRKLQFSSIINNGAFNFSYKFIAGGGFAVIGRNTYSEGDGTAIVTVGRVGNTDYTGTIDYAVQDDTAVAGTDYTAISPLSGTLVFAPGETRKTLTYGIVNNNVVNATTDFFVNLSNPDANSVILNNGGIYEITDDDATLPPPVNDNFANAINLASAGDTQAIGAGTATTEAGEGYGNTQSIWYKWTAPADGIVSVLASYSSNGSSSVYSVSLFTGTSVGQLTSVDVLPTPSFHAIVKAGTQYYIAVNGVDTTMQSSPEIDLSFSSTGNAFQMAKIAQFLAEGEMVNLTINRLGPATGTATVDYIVDLEDDLGGGLFDSTPYALVNEDYHPTGATVTFGPGVTTQTISFPTLKRATKAPPRHIVVELTNPSTGCYLDSPSGTVVRIYDHLSAVSFVAATEISPLANVSGPGGVGFITLKLTATGAVTGQLYMDGKRYGFGGVLPRMSTDVTGSFADTSVTIHRKGLSDIVISLHSQRSGGMQDFLSGTVSDAGSLAWHHPALKTGPVLTAFTSVLTPYVSRYAVPPGGSILPVTLPTSIQIVLDGGGLSHVVLPFSLRKGNIATPVAGTPGSPTLKFNGANAGFSGSYTAPGGKRISFQGVVTRNNIGGAGYFINAGSAGTVTLTAH